jgi:hypothetical protein
MLARMIMRPVKSEICPPTMKGKAVLIVPPATRKDRRAYKHDTSPQIPETPLEVLCDEEDEQLVTHEKGLVQGCSNRHPAREETYGIQTRSKTGSKSKMTELVKTAFIMPQAVPKRPVLYELRMSLEAARLSFGKSDRRTRIHEAAHVAGRLDQGVGRGSTQKCGLNVTANALV